MESNEGRQTSTDDMSHANTLSALRSETSLLQTENGSGSLESFCDTLVIISYIYIYKCYLLIVQRAATVTKLNDTSKLLGLIYLS